MLEGPLGVEPLETPSTAAPRSVLTSAAMLGGMTVAAKLVAFGKEWLVARRFGASDELDAYLIGFLIPSYAVAVLAHSFGSAFVPTYIRLLHHQGAQAARHLVGKVLTAGACLSIAATLALMAMARFLLPLVAPEFDVEKLALAEAMFDIMAGVLVATVLSAILAAILNAHEKFVVAAVAPLAVPIATIVVFWLFQGRYGIYALALGTLLGFVLESAVLAIAAWRLGLLARPEFRMDDANLRFVGRQYVPIVMASALISSSLVVDQSMAASLGSGNVSVLNYGTKIISLIFNIGAVSLSTVLFPRFARLITAGNWDELRRAMRVYTRTILLASIPGVGLLAFVSQPLVQLLFERGAFTPDITRAVAQVQMCLSLQIPFAVLAVLGSRLLSALDANRSVLKIGLLSLVLNVTGNYVLMHWFGVNGIALSTSLVYFVAALATYVALQSRLKGAEQAHARYLQAQQNHER